MFEVARMMTIEKEKNAEALKNEIIALLKMHKLSLSNARALFVEIIEEIEDSPL